MNTQGFLDLEAEEVIVSIRTKDGMQMNYKIENPRHVGMGFNVEVETGGYGYTLQHIVSSRRELSLKINY